MNRRHSVSSKRVAKKTTKEVKKGVVQEDTLVKKRAISAKKALTAPAKSVKAHKKPSKRTSPKEEIENSTPAYPHREGSRWMKVLNKQTTAKNVRFAKKGLKIKGK